MRRWNRKYGKHQPRKTSWWKKIGIYVISLQWVDWGQRAIWLLRIVLPFSPVIFPWLPAWIDVGQLNEKLNYIAEIET